MSISTTFDAASLIIEYQPSDLVIKSGTTTGYLLVSTDPRNVYGLPVDAPATTVLIGLTNYDSINMTGYIFYRITIRNIITELNLVFLGQNQFRVDILKVETNVGVFYIPGPGSKRSIRISINDVSYNIVVVDAGISPPKNFRVELSFSKAVEFQGLGGGFAGPLPPLPPLPPTSPTGNVQVRVPIIDIYGQTTIDGDYLSDMTFVIQDQYKYKCNENKYINSDHCYGCTIYYLPVNKLKTTTFQQNNIPLEDVVKGKGTLQEKVFKLYNLPLSPEFQNFYERFIRYAMLKYILIKLLYGSFDLCKLCRNFNKQFFKDLADSRFCGFIEFFEDPANGIIGFDQYYIKCSSKCDQDCKKY